MIAIACGGLWWPQSSSGVGVGGSSPTWECSSKSTPHERTDDSSVQFGSRAPLYLGYCSRIVALLQQKQQLRRTVVLQWLRLRGQVPLLAWKSHAMTAVHFQKPQWQEDTFWYSCLPWHWKNSQIIWICSTVDSLVSLWTGIRKPTSEEKSLQRLFAHL